MMLVVVAQGTDRSEHSRYTLFYRIPVNDFPACPESGGRANEASKGALDPLGLRPTYDIRCGTDLLPDSRRTQSG